MEEFKSVFRHATVPIRNIFIQQIIHDLIFVRKYPAIDALDASIMFRAKVFTCTFKD